MGRVKKKHPRKPPQSFLPHSAYSSCLRNWFGKGRSVLYVQVGQGDVSSLHARPRPLSSRRLILDLFPDRCLLGCSWRLWPLHLRSNHMLQLCRALQYRRSVQRMELDLNVPASRRFLLFRQRWPSFREQTGEGTVWAHEAVMPLKASL